jgi:hypothetical protein
MYTLPQTHLNSHPSIPPRPETISGNTQRKIFNNLHCKENPIYVFLFWELRALSPKFQIHVSVSDLYIPPVQQNRQTDPGNTVYKSLTDIQYECRNWETRQYNSVLEITL